MICFFRFCFLLFITISENFSYCHWNVNSLVAYHSEKLSLIEAYNSVYKHDFICISETLVLVEFEDKLIRADHSFGLIRGGVCIYYRESLAVKVMNAPFLT